MLEQGSGKSQARARARLELPARRTQRVGSVLSARDFVRGAPLPIRKQETGQG